MSEICCCPMEHHLFDVLIIGAGAVGCAVARELSRLNLKIGVLEKSYDVSQGASKSNSGIVHGGYDERHGTLKSQVCHRTNQMFDKLNRELNFGFKRIGSLVLAFSPQDEEKLRELYENGTKNGVHDLQLIGREQVLQMEPHVNREVTAALHCKHTGICSPYEYVIALAENAVENGVQFFLSHEVLDILQVSDETAGVNSDAVNKHHFLLRAKAEKKGHTFRSRLVINAGGTYADRIASMVGANDFRIIPRKGEYIILDRTQGALVNHVLFPVPTTKGKGILVSPTYFGNLLLGPTSRGGDEPMTQRDILKLIIGSAKCTIPTLDASKAITSYVGLRSKTDRADFIVEESKVPGFINAAGIDSPGLTSSYGVAQMVRAITLDCLKRLYNVEPLENTNFNPYRPPIIVPKGEEFDGSIDNSDPKKNIICRCERVTESEILDAMQRPLGPKDTDSIKRRTRAGMGVCQGSFCENRVVDVIAREKHVPADTVGRHAPGSSVLSHRKVTMEDRQLLKEISKL